MKKQDEGFTLIELLIVIVILGILATVVVFAVGGFRDEANDAVETTELAQVETAVAAYQISNPATAGTEADLGTFMDIADLQCTYAFDAAGAVTQTCP